MTTIRIWNISTAVWCPISGENPISPYVFLWGAPCRDADRILIFTPPHTHVKYGLMTFDGIKKQDPTKELLIFLGDRRNRVFAADRAPNGRRNIWNSYGSHVYDSQRCCTVRSPVFYFIVQVCLQKCMLGYNLINILYIISGRIVIPIEKIMKWKSDRTIWPCELNTSPVKISTIFDKVWSPIDL